MSLKCRIIDSFLVLCHPLISPVHLPSLLYLCLEHLGVLLLPHSHHVLDILLSLLLSKGLHLRLLQLHLFHVDLVSLDIIVMLDLLAQSQVLCPLSLRSLLLILYFSFLCFTFGLRLIHLIVEEQKAFLI
jgi:hypothetical protein